MRAELYIFTVTIPEIIVLYARQRVVIANAYAKKMSHKIHFHLRLLWLISLLIIAISPIKAQAPMTHGDSLRADFEQSLQQWKMLKTQHNDSYEYVVSWQSAFGFGHITTITVREGQVISRKYEERNSPDYLQPEDDTFEEEFAEESTNSDTLLHPKDDGFRGITLDEVYRECEEIHLQQNEQENWLYFTTDEAGILKVCSSVPFGCEDDCSEGVYISKFRWLE